MHGYIINLEKSVTRRKKMVDIFSGIKDFTYEFISAIDGRLLSESEVEKDFNVLESERRYCKTIQPGEIGCTLSHQKCYKKLLESDLKYVFIFEDDVYLRFSKDVISEIFHLAVNQLKEEIPNIILLSGWNYFTKKTKITEEYYKTKIVDGYLAHAYLINRKAAELMIEKRPWIVADHWKYFIKKGVLIEGIIPHCINQNGDIKSDITSGNDRFKFTKGFLLRNFRRLWHLIFKFSKHYEKADKEYI